MLYVTVPALPLFFIAAGGAAAFGIAITLLIFSVQYRVVEGAGLRRVAVISLAAASVVVAAVVAVLLTYTPEGVYR